MAQQEVSENLRKYDNPMIELNIHKKMDLLHCR